MNHLNITFPRMTSALAMVLLTLASLGLSGCSEANNSEANNNANSNTSQAQVQNDNAQAAPVSQSEPSTSAQSSGSAQSNSSQYNENSIRANFSKLGLLVSTIAESEIDGVYAVDTQQGTLFTNATGDKFIQGKLYGINDNGGLTDYAALENAEKLKAYEDEMIVYKAEDEKHVITVFTDITCGYCIKLHKEMQSYLDQGVTVRYLAFPRQGLTGNVAQDMAKVWCATDQKTALDKVKLNQSFDFDSENISQCQSIIAKHYQLGVDFGVRGTPAIILENGTMIGGYMPADKMIAAIEEQ